MKKHLKKALFVFTFAMITIVAHARLWTITCTNGNVYNYISLEEADSQTEIDDVHQAGSDLCS
jgi:hypothetical protein